MATTSARITLSSSDLVSDTMSISKTFELNAAGTTTGALHTTGLRRQTMGSTAETLLIDGADYTTNQSHWLFIHNTSTTATRYIQVSIGTIGGSSIVMSRIYDGEWAFIPYNGTEDINIAVNNTDIVVEWTLIYE
jgi:hypothetical protein